MLSAGFSVVAIDNARTSERLSAFLSEIGATEPVENYFTKNQTIDWLWKSKKSIDGGAQIMYPISTGENPNMQWAGDYDVVSTSASDNARMVIYPFVNIFGSIVISWEEMREIAGSDHKIFDRVKFKRDEALKTVRKKINAALYAAAQVDSQVTTLAIAVDSSGTTGGLSAATYANWAANEVAHGAPFGAGGYKAMCTKYNDVIEDGGDPKVVVTTQTIYESYEDEINADVTYAQAEGMGGRGFSGLTFKKKPIVFDGDCTSQVIYFFDTEYLFPMVDTEGDIRIDEFKEAYNQRVFAAMVTFRGNVIINKRNAQAKITGVS